MRLPIVLATLVATALPAMAAEPDYYLDDRSSPAQLLRSFYNAVNRKEYARAWDYFGEQKPARDFESFVAGYSKTGGVRIKTGQPSSEGAAGSQYFNLPVAIQATDSNGNDTVFSGCYVLRQVDPTVQAPPFRPLSIERATLEKSEEYLDDAVPQACAGAPAPDGTRQAVIEQAKTLFRASYSETCDVFADGFEQATPEPDFHAIRYRPTGSEPNAAEEEVQLLRFYCGAGAYNESHHYYLASQYEGVQELQFARPELDIHYENDNYEGKVEGIDIVGFRTDAALVNSDYDPETKTITDFSKWRGIADASSNGVWRFENGRFVLVKFDVDATYDGEINSETIYEAKP